MSDGNFNRALLRPGSIQSGLAMGKAIARREAIAAFDRYYAHTHPEATNDEATAARNTFLSFFAPQ